MRFYFILLVVFQLFIACEHKNTIDKRFPEKQSYFLYRPIVEVYDSSKDVMLRYEVIDRKPSMLEQDSIVSLLKQFNWQYKMTEDSELLISTYSMKNMDDLYFLQSELDKKIKR